jgi:hypothetical protein
MTIIKIKRGEYEVDVKHFKLRIRRDFYKGGWFVWTATTSVLKWKNERFMTRADAIRAIKAHYAD